MKKFYTLLLCALSVFAVSAQGPMKAKGDVRWFDGTVDIDMSGNPITSGMPVSISLTEQDASNVYELVLADFRLDIIPRPLGDIVVPNVTFTDDNGDGKIDVSGSVENLSLAEGMIWADVNISTMIPFEGETLDLKIDVIWYPAYPDKNTEMPITVAFTGKERENAGVAGLDGDAVSVYGVAGAVKVDGFSGVAEVYSVDGRLVKAQTVSDGSQIDLVSGLYIVRAAGKSVKVAVR